MNTLMMAILMLLIGPPQVAVQAENATFKILVNGVEVGTEEFTLAPNGDGFLARGHTRLRVGAQQLDAESTMYLDRDLRPLSYEYRSGSERVRIVIDDPVSSVTFGAESEGRTLDIRFDSGGAIVDDNFFHHYQILLYRFGAQGGNVPVLVPHQMTVGPLTVQPTGSGTFELATENLELNATTDANGRLVRLSVPAANVVVER